MKTDGTSTIEINGMKFHSRIGILPEEKEKGVDLTVDFKGKINVAKAVAKDDIALVPDVREICRMVEEEVMKPCNLLETLADRIVRSIRNSDLAFYAIKVKVSKLCPGLYGAESWSATARMNWDNENSDL